MRLNNPVSAGVLQRINREFKDMVTDGGFEKMNSIEQDDMKDPKLERIVFNFNRTHYSRLRQLIDVFNANPR